MPGEWFYWIVNMSLVASLMGLAVWAVRRLRVLPRRIAVFLWIVPFMRMVCPYMPNSRYSLMALLIRLAVRSVAVRPPGTDLGVSAVNLVVAAQSYHPLTYRAWAFERVFTVGGWIWLAGAGAVLLTMAGMYLSALREVRDARRLVPYGNVYLSEKARGPAVYGVIRPRIVLPASYAKKDPAFVLRHEETHIRRGDNLWRLLGFAAAAIHWFNPLAWLFLREFLSDLELACDEAVVSRYGEEDRRAYAQELLDAARGGSPFASAFGGAGVRKRIESILSYRRMTGLSAVCFAVLAAAVAWALLTNAGG